MSKFFSSQTTTQILLFATGTFRGHIFQSYYYKPMKTSEVNNRLNKFQAKLITASFRFLGKGGGGNNTAEFAELFL